MKLLLFFIFEIGLFSYFAENYGFLDTLLWYWGPTILAFTFMPMLLRRFQNSSHSLHLALVNLGLLSMALPFVSLRIIGLFMILPGFRHLLIWKLSGFIKTQMTQYQTSNPNGNFFYFRSQNTTWPTSERPPMKDVTPTTATRIENHSDQN